MAGSVASLVGPMLVPGGSPAWHEAAAGGDREATPRWRVWPCAGEWHPAFRHTPAAWPGGVLVFDGVGPPRRRVCHDRGPIRIGGPVREPRRTGGRCPATAAPGHAPVPGGRAPLRGSASHEAEG